MLYFRLSHCSATATEIIMGGLRDMSGVVRLYFISWVAHYSSLIGSRRRLPLGRDRILILSHCSPQLFEKRSIFSGHQFFVRKHGAKATTAKLRSLGSRSQTKHTKDNPPTKFLPLCSESTGLFAKKTERFNPV